MPRGPHIDAPGTPHHVIIRGIERHHHFGYLANSPPDKLVQFVNNVPLMSPQTIRRQAIRFLFFSKIDQIICASEKSSVEIC